MSKTFRSFLFVFAAVVQILHFFNDLSAQDVKAFIKIDSQAPTKVAISGRFLKWGDIKNLSFLSNLGDISGLGDRISNVEVFDKDDQRINIRRMMSGEYLAESAFTKWSYRVDLTPRKEPFAAAHISWLANGGFLMLNDLLPQFDRKTAVAIGFTLPRDWVFADTEKIFSPDTLWIPNPEKAVFIIDTHEAPRRLSVRQRLELNISGNWLFSDEKASETATSIFSEYERLLGVSPAGEFIVAIRKFPRSTAIGTWEADTRGRTITIISSDANFKSQSLQQLHEQMRHEMFHLWIPNGVNLNGNYDWFYEGFALYQSLKTGVALNRIRFDDYLDTLSRAYDIDKRLGQKLSLIEVSKNRWTGDNNTRVYARGMLVAFLCDLALLEKSKGKQSVTDILRKFYEKHRPPSAETDGNTAVLALLRSYTELTPMIERNITGAESVDWNSFIKAAGLEVDSTDQTTNLKVTVKPTGRQKDLLDKLGYNNWRKLSSK
ncbi:MAG: hypothetical protein IPL32_12225 [Chloracidobacterium sp.]|nr:hypothetical protein [Chloracidobacterium sp.]